MNIILDLNSSLCMKVFDELCNNLNSSPTFRRSSKERNDRYTITSSVERDNIAYFRINYFSNIKEKEVRSYSDTLLKVLTPVLIDKGEGDYELHITCEATTNEGLKAAQEVIPRFTKYLEIKDKIKEHSDSVSI